VEAAWEASDKFSLQLDLGVC
nr:hypothetical protein [Tanacetum cinerariifolium]